ncbi:T9SS type A sorting domain-containing protein [Fluviicola taffensis]|uniref:Glycosyl hydrolase n=1 Tax=Fluviicola taffensis (strain DSM 16823 / NCIMB 13979 / RW262) TaxID=755732 RepID=F2IDZ5_FLUTR|nr:T9SS type A sorting domain-containing protein [Fluviicola taffensis]AEA45559.1 glycosyl hydrolase [Fluviicola taffensis DSM 16823]
MAFSVYLKDSLAPFYTFSCDSLNALVDTLLNLQSHYVNPNNVFLYPNPSNGILKIGSSLKEFNLKSIELIGVNGMAVGQKNSSEDIKTSLYEFDFSSLASGLYTVILISKDNQRYIKKWSKL